MPRRQLGPGAASAPPRPLPPGSGAWVHDVRVSYYPPGVSVQVARGEPGGPGRPHSEELPVPRPLGDAREYLRFLREGHAVFRQDPGLAKEVAAELYRAQRAGAAGEYRPAWSARPHVLGTSDCLLSLCGDAAASLGQDRSVRLLALDPAGAVFSERSLDLHRNQVVCGAFNFPSCDRLLTGSLDGTARLWSVPDGKPLACLRPEGGPAEVFSVSAEVSGPLVCVGTRAGAALIWDAERTDLPPAQLDLHGGLVARTAFSSTEVGWASSGGLLLSAGLDGSVLLTDLRGARRGVLSAGAEPRGAGDFGASGDVGAHGVLNRLASARAPKQLVHGAPPSTLCSGEGELTAIAHSRSFSIIAVGYSSGLVSVYDLRVSGGAGGRPSLPASANAPALFRHGFGAQIMDLAFSPRSRYLCVSVASYDGSSRLQIVPPPGFAESAPKPKGGARGGARAAGGAHRVPVAYVISMESGSCVGALSGFPGDIRRLCFQAAGFGARLFAGGVDGEIRVWEGPDSRSSLTERQRLSMDSPVTGMAVSEDGRLVLGSDQSGNVRLWALK